MMLMKVSALYKINLGSIEKVLQGIHSVDGSLSRYSREQSQKGNSTRACLKASQSLTCNCI
eukprot:1157609-Pelagomonas_calceolata.AAC.3